MFIYNFLKSPQIIYIYIYIFMKVYIYIYISGILLVFPLYNNDNMIIYRMYIIKISIHIFIYES